MENIFGIQDFVVFLKSLEENNGIKIYFNEVIVLYEQSLGGCSCNRRNRENTAEQIFVNKINEGEVLLIHIKNILNLDKISFKRMDNTIFKRV